VNPLLPAPRTEKPISIRVATPEDIPWMDSLHKKRNFELGWCTLQQFEGYIRDECILIAESSAGVPARTMPIGAGGDARATEPLGYVMFRDRYFKRDEVGYIVHLNVAEGSQRKLIGAALVQEVFDRAAYGCRLYSCWCRQDLAANYFWEAIGFKPLAFRAGGRSRQQIQIFWQKRVRAGDEETPYWYPSWTTAGAIREDRLVFPIPPGTHWSDAKPMVLPGGPGEESGGRNQELEGGAEDKKEKNKNKRRTKKGAPPQASDFLTIRNGEVITNRKDPRLMQPYFETAAQREERLRLEEEAKKALEQPKAKKKKEKVEKKKADPKHVAGCRELRDRYLEAVNDGKIELPGGGKYDVERALPADDAPATRLTLPTDQRDAA